MVSPRMELKLINRLAECRTAKGISKSQLAFYLKLDRASVTRLERGDIRPRIETALRLAAYFKKPVDEIFQLVEVDREGQPVTPAKGLDAFVSSVPPKSNFPASLGSVGEQTTNHTGTKKGE